MAEHEPTSDRRYRAPNRRDILPEYEIDDSDDARLLASIEDARRAEFAELASL